MEILRPVARLVLQLPSPEAPRKALVIAASDDQVLVRSFCATLLARAEAATDAAGDPFSRELARIQFEQLRARLAFALGSLPESDRLPRIKASSESESDA
jgi:hypothetical protein